MFPSSIHEDMIKEIINIADKTQEATIFNKNNKNTRKSRVSWIKDVRVLNLLYQHVGSANISAFNFHVYNVADIQFTEYLATENGHYNWHHDIDWQNNNGYDRKLSLTVQLSEPSEYEGGNFVFDEVDSPDSNILKQKGTVLVFPSYLRHRVEPVTKGVRRSLVSWFEGPSWR